MIECEEGIESIAIMNRTTSKIKSVVGGKNFWKFRFDYTTALDKNYYVMSGAESEAMDFPPEIKYNHVRLRNPEQLA